MLPVSSEPVPPLSPEPKSLRRPFSPTWTWGRGLATLAALARVGLLFAPMVFMGGCQPGTASGAHVTRFGFYMWANFIGNIFSSSGVSWAALPFCLLALLPLSSVVVLAEWLLSWRQPVRPSFRRAGSIAGAGLISLGVLIDVASLIHPGYIDPHSPPPDNQANQLLWGYWGLLVCDSLIILGGALDLIWAWRARHAFARWKPE